MLFLIFLLFSVVYIYIYFSYFHFYFILFFLIFFVLSLHLYFDCVLHFPFFFKIILFFFVFFVFFVHFLFLFLNISIFVCFFVWNLFRFFLFVFRRLFFGIRFGMRGLFFSIVFWYFLDVLSFFRIFLAKIATFRSSPLRSIPGLFNDIGDNHDILWQTPECNNPILPWIAENPGRRNLPHSKQGFGDRGACFHEEGLNVSQLFPDTGMVQESTDTVRDPIYLCQTGP